MKKFKKSISETNIFRPYFEKTSHDATVQLGDSAFFECHIFNLHNQTVHIKKNIEQIPGVSSKKYQVSWIRRSDGYPLYIGEERFINDKRFELISTRWVGQQARWVLGCLEQLLLGSNKVKVPQHTWEVTLN